MIMKNDPASYEQIITLNSEKMKIDIKIRDLKPKAVKELRLMGYSYDRIVRMLNIGKVNAIRWSK